MQYRVIVQRTYPNIGNYVQSIREYLSNEPLEVFSSLPKAIHTAERVVGYLYSKGIYDLYVAVVQVETCGCTLKITDVNYLHQTKQTQSDCSNEPLASDQSINVDTTQTEVTLPIVKDFIPEYDDYSVQLIEQPVNCTIRPNGHYVVLSEFVPTAQGNSETIQIMLINNNTSCSININLTINYQ